MHATEPMVFVIVVKKVSTQHFVMERVPRIVVKVVTRTMGTATSVHLTGLVIIVNRSVENIVKVDVILKPVIAHFVMTDFGVQTVQTNVLLIASKTATSIEVTAFIVNQDTAEFTVNTNVLTKIVTVVTSKVITLMYVERV